MDFKDDAKRGEVASDLAVLTSNPTSLSAQSIQNLFRILDEIVSTKKLKQNVCKNSLLDKKTYLSFLFNCFLIQIATLVIKSLANLLAAPKKEIKNSELQKRYAF